jgi:hypothetical protein
MLLFNFQRSLHLRGDGIFVQEHPKDPPLDVKSRNGLR